MDTSELRAIIRAAFKGVRLGGGCSLRSAEEARFWGEPPDTAPDAFPEAEIFDDWAALSLATLEHYPYLAHMDAAGLRYYIPAFMLSVLDDYDYASMRVICTLGALYPRKDERWDYYRGLYSLLDRTQRVAIARFLNELPALVELYPDDRKGIERALRNFWHASL